MNSSVAVTEMRLGRLFVIAAAFAVLNWNPFRAIWLDEVIQYCLAPFDSLSEAWSIFVLSLTSMNPGQTGAYHVANYLLLNFLGASPWALRFPSFFASIYSYWIALILLRQLGVSLPFRIAALLLIFLNPWITYAFSDARAYPFIVLGFSSALLFYLSETWPNRRRLRIIAYPALILSALFHPYFIIYFASAWAVGLTLLIKDEKVTLRRLYSYTAVPFVLPLIALYGAISYATWFTHPAMANFGFDPYEYLEKGVHPVRSVFSYHLASFSWMRTARAIPVLMTAFSPIIAFRTRRDDPSRSLFFVSACLFWLCLGASGIVCWQSIRKSYWILPRQWVGSSFGINLAVCISLQAYVWRYRDRFKWVRFSPWAFLAPLAVLGALYAWGIQRQNVADLSAMAMYAEAAGKIPAEKRNASPELLVPAEAVALAKFNMAEGGRVWPVFKRFYGGFVPQARGEK
jgi:hypothetical protein